MSTQPHRFSAEDRRHQILEVARGLFARKGYNGTTTREIASGAGVNEALIFRHFPSKEELYWAVIDSSCQAGGSKAAMEHVLASGRDLHEVFTEIAEGILERREKDPTFTRLLLYSALENHELTKRFFTTFAGHHYNLLTRFIQEQIEKGLFRRVDPYLAARGFLGMVIYHSLVENLFLRGEHFSNRRVAETISNIWLRGVLADTASCEQMPGTQDLKAVDKRSSSNKR